jgi:hypothetical protein
MLCTVYCILFDIEALYDRSRLANDIHRNELTRLMLPKFANADAPPISWAARSSTQSCTAATRPRLSSSPTVHSRLPLA